MMRPKIDEVSLLVTADPAISLETLEKYLQKCGYSLGYRPLSGKKGLTLQKILEERIPNRYANRYGGIDDICLALNAQTQFGVVRTKRVPRAATGPDLKKIFIGSGGSYGKILEGVFRIVPLPSGRRRVQIVWKDSKKKEEFLKQLWACGARPARIVEGRSNLLIDIEGMKEIADVEIGCLKRLAQRTRGRMTKRESP